MSIELKPCPFCGSEAEIMGDQYPYVECQECAAGFTANHSYEFDRADAASKWNARAQGGQDVEPQNCPRCHSDSVGCNSSRELQVSEVDCGDCGFSLQAEVDEDTVIELWNLIRTESCADYEEYADTRAELAEIDSPQPPQEGE